MENEMKLYNTETFSLEEKKESGGTKFILQGNAMPLGETSRNGVYYRPESVKKAVKTLEGNSFLFAHQQEQVNHVLGHVEEAGLTDTHVTYKVNIDPKEEDFIRKSKRGDIKNVSVGAIIDPETVKIDEDNGIAYVDVKEFAELSSAPVPGYKNTSAQLGQQVIALAEKMGDENKVKKLKEKINTEEDIQQRTTTSFQNQKQGESKENTPENPSSDNTENNSEVNESYKEADKEEDKEPDNSENTQSNEDENKDSESGDNKKTDEENDSEDQDGEKTTEEKVSDLNSKVEDLNGKYEEIQNRLSALESKIDQILEDEENKESKKTESNAKENIKEQYKENFKENNKKEEQKPNIDSKQYQQQKDKVLETDDKNPIEKVNISKQIKKNKKY